MILRASDITVREASPRELARWDDLVRRFANHRVTHLRAWTESLVASGRGTPLALVYEREGDIVGCQPGLLSKVGPWPLYGSPRAGWQTSSMGPAFDPERLDTTSMLGALVPYLEREHGVAHIELMHGALDPDAMRAAGFVGEPVPTYRAPLHPGDEKRTFKSLRENARRNVQRAERLGLEVRFEEDDAFVDEHFDQVREVFRRGGHSVPFAKERLRQYFLHLRDSGNLIAVSVYLPGGRVNIASGMFSIEANELLLWSWAHRERYRWYRPTELMTWTVMRRAMAAGCDTFDLMGRGEFKRKFGAQPDESKWRWLRSRPEWLARARSVAERGYRWQQSLRGQTRRVAGLVAGATSRAATRSRADAPACVIGDADLVRCLGLGGIRSVVLSPPGAAARYSRFTRGALEWRDPWEGPEALVEELVAYASAQPEPPVLFYQEDRSLLLVSRNRERLKKLFRFVIADAELVEALVDKERFLELSRRLALPIPPTWSLLALEELAVESLHLEYPVIVKPVVRRQDRWAAVSGGAKALRAENPAELRAAWSRMAAAGMRVIVQSLVPGPESAIESYHTYVDDHGVVADFTGRKIRTAPAEYGDSSSLEITDAEDVRALGQDIVKRMGLRGVAKLDFKRAPDGTLYLLEVNPRFTLWHHAGALAGVNIPALVYGDCVGWTRPAVSRARAGVRWCKVWTDHAAARGEGMPFARWLTWALRCEAKSAFAWDDPLPLLGAGLQRWLGRRRTDRPVDTKVSEQATRPGTADPGSSAALHGPHGRST